MTLSLAPHGTLLADESAARQQGQSLLQEGKVDQAMDAFIAAISQDNRDFHAMHGLALCQHAAGEVDRAAHTLRQAVHLADDRVDANLVVNLAAIEMELDNAMAAATLCTRYLKRLDGSPDENVLNSLGIALAIAQRDHAATPAFNEAATVFVTRTATLEAARPGMKRWGTAWVTADEYQELADSPPMYPPRIELLPLGEPPAPDADAPRLAEGAPLIDEHPPKREQPGAAPARSQPAIAIPIGPDLLLTPSHAIGAARNVRLESTQGVAINAQVVRTDARRKLALLKTEGPRMMYLNLADNVDGGPVECAAVLRPVVFNIAPEIISGAVRRDGESWTVQLEKQPHLGGSPLTRDGLIVGIVVNAADAPDGLEMVPVGEIRGFLGSDLPRPTRMQPELRSAIYHVTNNK